MFGVHTILFAFSFWRGGVLVRGALPGIAFIDVIWPPIFPGETLRWVLDGNQLQSYMPWKWMFGFSQPFPMLKNGSPSKFKHHLYIDLPEIHSKNTWKMDGWKLEDPILSFLGRLGLGLFSGANLLLVLGSVTFLTGKSPFLFYNGRYIFQSLFFHCHVCFPGCDNYFITPLSGIQQKTDSKWMVPNCCLLQCCWAIAW